MEDLKVGDVVKLKGDTQRMAIEEIKDGKALCRWRNKKRGIESEWHPVELLIKPGGIVMGGNPKIPTNY